MLAKPALAYTNGMAAQVVIGQSNFTSNSANQGSSVNANGFEYPYGIATDGTRLFVSDNINSRVLIYNKIPTTNGASADVVIGQPNFTSNLANQGGSVAANTLANPQQVATDGTRLFITDSSNYRVLIYNRIPTTNNASADIVIGQTNMTSGLAGGSTATTLCFPTAVDYDSSTGKLAISDGDCNRILIYNRVPTTNGAAADVAVGAPNLTTATLRSSPSASDLSGDHVQFADRKLISVDIDYNRVLIWNNVPATHGASADVVIGQSNFTSGSANQGGNAAANTLSGPRDANYDGKRLFVQDATNNRILIFDGIPSANNASAYIVLGQPNFTSTSAPNPPSASSLSDPEGYLTFANNRLITGDSSNNRVLIYENIVRNPEISLTGELTVGAGGKFRIQGRATVDSLYTLQKIEYSINGSVWHAVTAADDGLNSSAENFFLDFDKSDNDNKLDGFTVRLHAQNTNLDKVERAFFFDPFKINSPKNDEATSSALPTFDFSVNKQREALRDNLEKYQIQIAKYGTEAWKVYVDNIPVDFQSVKNLNENLQREKYQNAATNNGVYETNLLTATYSEESSRISVTPKDVVSHYFPFGKKLETGDYRWKVVSFDKSGKTQETPTYNLKIESSQSAYTTWSQVQGTSIQEPETDATGHFLPSPAPSPSPKTDKTSIKSEPSTENKLCIWKLCLPRIDLWPF